MVEYINDKEAVFTSEAGNKYGITIDDDGAMWLRYTDSDGEEYELAIRKLMPVEAWRLMGFGTKTDNGWEDPEFDKAASVNSNTQLYKQAGNGIVTVCLAAILERLYEHE